jgi:RHS repeat-associated protein
MLRLLRNSPLLRALTLFTIATFLPSAAGAWNFVDMRTTLAADPDDANPWSDLPWQAAGTEPDTPLPWADKTDSSAPIHLADNADPEISVLDRDEMKKLASPPATEDKTPQKERPISLAELEAARTSNSLQAAPALTKIATSSTASQSTTSTDKIILAQLTPAIIASAMAGQAPYQVPAEAQAMLNEAQAKVDAGDAPGAAMDYLNVLDSFPHNRACLAARDGIGALASRMAHGEFSPEALQAFAKAMPAISDLKSTESRYAVLDFYDMQAHPSEVSGDRETALAADRIIRAGAYTAMLQDMNHPLQVDIVFKYYDTCEFESRETHLEGVSELGSIISSSPPCMTTWSAKFWLANYFQRLGNDPNTAKLYYRQVINELGQGFVQKALDDPAAYPWIQATIEWMIASAYHGINDYASAVSYYQHCLDTYGRSVSREIHDHASLGLTYASISLGEVSPSTIVQALYNHLQTYPENFFNPEVHLELANTYNKYEMYDDAIAAYEQVIKKYPNTNGARSAQSELDYLYTNVVGTMQIARKSDSGVSAQMCGPIALAKLLQAQGVNVSSEDLAKLAGTDGTGTTMLGLVEAAKSKGIEITGVRAASLASLKTPFIAHVNGDHFVVVRQVTDDKVTVDDADNATKTESIAQFGARWQGNAIILGSARTVTQPLEIASLKSVKGGHYPLGTYNGQNPDQDPPDPPPCDTCDCDEQGQGSGHGAGAGGGCNGGSPTSPGDVTSPWALTGVSAPGVHPIVNASTLGLYLTETDISMPVRGGVLSFRRAYTSDAGYHKSGYTDINKTYSNNIGSGWTHNWNIHLRSDATTNPLHTDCWGGRGRVQKYERESTSTAMYSASCVLYDHFLCRQSEVAISEPFQQVTGTNKMIWDELNGHRYQFSVPDSSADHFSFLETATDLSENTFSLSYSSGRLTKVTAPITGYTLNFSYSGNLITKVELKKSGVTPALETMQYAYNGSNELTKVTDNDGNFVTYTYASNSNATGSRFIDSITDKMGNVTTLTYTFASGATRWEAQKLEFVNVENNKTVYDRSLSTGACTITNVDGTTVLSKMAHTPVADDFVRTKYKDHYTDTTNYERWEYLYDSNGWLTQIKRPDTSTHVTYSYTSNGRISTVTTPGMNATTFYYTSSGNYATKMTAPDGTETFFDYDGNGRITKVRPPHLGTAGVTYGYDSSGQITAVTNALAKTTTYQYNTDGRLIRVTDALSNNTDLFYDDRGNVTKVTDPRLKSTYFYYAAGGCGSCGGGGGKLTKVKDPLNNETLLYYDTNGNMTKVTDALTRSTSYEYDYVNRMTKIVSPTDGTDYASFTYDKLNHVVTKRDFEAKLTTYEYNFRGQLTKTVDPVDDVTLAYTSAGNLSTVTDGLGHTWTYAYDSGLRLTSIVDPVTKYVKYFYDTAGRMTKVGAGSAGTFDPTEYSYSTTTGLMTAVSYTAGANVDTANYYYDSGARLTKLSDWIDPTNGLRYAFDDADRLTKITDYDNSYLTYVYDAGGNVTSMTDYHGNATSYTYTDRNQLSTLTAPGSKVWTFHYNAIGQPTYYDVPNGMTTNYAYDTKNRLTAIEHKDGTTVLDGFTYALDKVGNITKTTHEDASYWDYLYDNRYRLTSAVRKNSTGHIQAAYTYTYDGGDNLLTKVEPFMDDYNDGAYTGWTVGAGTWSASSNYLSDTVAAAQNDFIWKNDFTDDDHESRFSYRKVSTGSSEHIYFYARYVDGNSYIRVDLKGDGTARILQDNAGTFSDLATNNSVSVSTNTWYDVRVVADSATVKVYRKTGANMETEILSTTSAAVTSSSKVGFATTFYAKYDIDNVCLLGSSPNNTTTFAVNNANELTSITDPNGTTTFAFDAWGRMTSKSRTPYSTGYSYKYGDLLTSVNSDFPGEGSVTYGYNGEGMRRERVAGGNTTRFNWEGYSLVNEEDGTGTLIASHLADGLAFVSGSNPASGNYRYYTFDHLGSTSEFRDQSKAAVAWYEYGPYGIELASAGENVLRRYTDHAWDADAGLYYAPYRYLAPGLSRWLTRDPLRMIDGPNMYLYVMANPVCYLDPLGAALSGPILALAGGCTLADGPLPIGDLIALALIAGALIINVCSKGGKQNIKDTALENVGDDVVADQARNKDLDSKDRRRFQREEKARKQRNKQKR